MESNICLVSCLGMKRFYLVCNNIKNLIDDILLKIINVK